MAIQDAHLPTSKLSLENYQKGFLIDDQWMAGISEDPDQAGCYWAFIVNHQSGEYVTAHSYSKIDDALIALNRVDRPWNFEATKSCGGGNCGNGSCGKENCSKS